MTDLPSVLHQAPQAAADFHATLADRPVALAVDAGALRARFGAARPPSAMPPDQVLRELIQAAEPGLVASAGPRFFGFVVGGSVPAAAAADMLAVGWDQMAFNAVTSPAAAAAEAVAGRWLRDLLGIPETASVGFATGGQAADTVGLAAARHRVLADKGWDVERDGLFGAPTVRVVAGVERHATIDRSLRLLGFGSAIVEPVAADANGGIDIADLARVLDDRPAGPTIVCLQAATSIPERAMPCGRRSRSSGRAAAGCTWTARSGCGPRQARPPAPWWTGLELADSWACDGHKWLNVPYDSGFVFCADPQAHVAAASYAAAYLQGSGGTAGAADLVLESSCRARGFAVWAALQQLGRNGVAELVDHCCRLARQFAERLAAGGAEIVNDVVLNQTAGQFR